MLFRTRKYISESELLQIATVIPSLGAFQFVAPAPEED